MNLTNRTFAIQYTDAEQRVKLCTNLNGRAYPSVRLISKMTPKEHIDVPMITFETYFNYNGIITDEILDKLSINRNEDSNYVAEIKAKQLPVIQDPIVENVIRKYISRSDIGIEKYRTSLHDSKESILAFLNHFQQELFDASLYAEKLIQKITKEN